MNCRKYNNLVWVGGLVLFFGVFVNVAHAVPNPPPIEVLAADPIFSVQNAAPGEEFESAVTILNHGPDMEKFQFEIQNEKMSADLAKHLFFKIKDDQGNCLFGCDKNYDIDSLIKDEIVIEKIKPHSTNVYTFILVLDENLGNNFQGLATAFDIKLGYKGKRPGGGGGAGGAAGPGVGPAVAGAAFLAGLPGAGAVAGEQIPSEQPSGEVKGEEAAPGEVQGAEACHGWPKWVWILMLIVYFAAFLWRTFDKFKEQVEKHEIRRVWQAALAVAAFTIWYFFDKCREFWWFVILALVGGTAVYLAYLYLFRERIKERHEEIESGSEQKPPEVPT